MHVLFKYTWNTHQDRLHWGDKTNLIKYKITKIIIAEWQSDLSKTQIISSLCLNAPNTPRIKPKLTGRPTRPSPATSATHLPPLASQLFWLRTRQALQSCQSLSTRHLLPTQTLTVFSHIFLGLLLPRHLVPYSNVTSSHCLPISSTPKHTHTQGKHIAQNVFRTW